MNRRYILIIAVLILVPTLILFLVSYFVQPVLPPPWNNVLILLGIVLAAILAALSNLNDVVQLVDRFTGREEFDSDSQDFRIIVRVVEPVCAREYLTQALTIYEAIKAPEAERVRGRLAELPE